MVVRSPGSGFGGLDGATGSAGPAGATGPAGPAGPTGAAGKDGAVGATGPAGPTGPTGAAGPAGATGAAGKDGAAGASGAVGPAGPVGPTGATGSAGPAGPAGAAGAVGPAGPTIATASASNRALGTVFQPSATRPVFVSYSVKTQVTNPLVAGSSTATVTLLSDAANPPTTERARDEATSSVGLAVSIALTTSNTAPLAYVVPPGHYVKLVSTVVGTGTTAIVSQTEVVLGA